MTPFHLHANSLQRKCSICLYLFVYLYKCNSVELQKKTSVQNTIEHCWEVTGPGHQYWWLADGYDLEILHFVLVSMVVM